MRNVARLFRRFSPRAKLVSFVCAAAFATASAVGLPSARAQFHVGPVASGMGGAGVAGTEASESSFLNPASLSFIDKYNVALDYQVGDHPSEGLKTTYAAQISDGHPDRIVPGALSYVHRFSEPGALGGSYVEQDIQLAFSGFVLPRLAIGASAHRTMLRPSVGDEVAQNNGAIGALLALTHDVGVGAVAYDVLPSSAALPYPLRQVPTYAIGVQWAASEILKLRADASRPTEGPRNGRNNVMAGLETQFRSGFLFRAGYQWRETDDRGLATVGLGIRGPRLSLEYAYEKDVRVASAYRHRIDLWMPLW